MAVIAPFKKVPTKRKKSYKAWADQLRNDAAKKYAPQFLEKFNPERAKEMVSRSFLADHVETFPLNGLRTISFNLWLAEHLVNELCESFTDALDLAYLSSKIGEATYRTFINPDNITERVEYLAPSKSMGYFFTPPDVALLMAEKLLVKDNGKEVDVLDPAAGYGSLLVATLIKATEKKVGIRSITAIEIDTFSAHNLEKILRRVIDLLNIDTKLEVKNGDAIEVLSDVNRLYSPSKRYDRIIMNPPYGRVKFLKSFLTNKETRSSHGVFSLQDQEAKWKKKTDVMMERLDLLSKELGFSSNLREYSKLFLTLALSNIKEDGRMSVISPSTWLGDKESHEVRRLVIDNNYLEEVHIFPEDSGLFETVNQHTAVSIFSKSKNDTFKIVSNQLGPKIDELVVEYSQLRSLDPELLKIPRYSKEELEIYKCLKTNPSIATIPGLKNLRGEVDLSLNKDLVSNLNTNLRLIRGDHVERYVLHPAEKSKRDSYIDPEKLEQKSKLFPKFSDIQRFRIVGRQCSYLDKKRRLDFALLSPGNVVGNSCNYLYFTDDDPTKVTDRLLGLMGLLNSAVIEWYFRLYNSNNHVANYEIADFPVCLDSKFLPLIARSASFLISAYENTPPFKNISRIEDFHDALVGVAYGLTPEMIGCVIRNIEPDRETRVVNFAEKIIDGLPINDFLRSEGWFNHYAPALSELDQQIIKYVPQGGNWQDIPEHVPSQRLKQIRDMSAERGVVRTTYYGRLRPDQPSYTVATYFNRPGNGTNIHPWEDRTLSSREGARLQSFPDSYLFFGSEGGIRTQIGNAVPPLLAHALGKHLGDSVGYGTCVDAFAGGGGLSLGLELAGWDIIAANDNDKHASITYKMNRLSSDGENDQEGRTAFIEGDITDTKITEQFLNAITKKLAGKQLDLLAGGPPCQGFSHAGFRRKDDVRNNLASLYLEIAAELKPRTFVLENVEGLLTYNSGQVVRDLIQSLKDLGYKIEEPWVLNAEQFGVPQMRRRVLLVANRKEIVSKLRPYFRKCPGRRSAQTIIDTHLPHPTTVAEALIDLGPLKKRRYTKGLVDINPLYSQWLRGVISTPEFLSQRARRAE